MKANHPNLYKFINDSGDFEVRHPEGAGPLYFPLVNEAGMLSAITPGLAGDIKVDQHTFLTPPVSRDDLATSRAARNFWLSFRPEKGGASKPHCPWAVNGRSAWQRAEEGDTVHVKAGLLWHEMTRTNSRLGVQATVTNFVPAGPRRVEVMAVQIKNTGKNDLHFVPTAAVPLYGRSADNLRDHRHVTSLLNRIEQVGHGLRLRPTMSFNERGHLINKTHYYVLGIGPGGAPPKGIFPTMDSFTGTGDLEKPAALLNGHLAPHKVTAADQGKEAMGGLQFGEVRLKPGETADFTILLGIDPEGNENWRKVAAAFDNPQKVQASLKSTIAKWTARNERLSFQSGDSDFNLWAQWVTNQPTFRKIFGCSFLPDFDYGRGGRGWRDLWQDILALILTDPETVRGDILHNFAGVRIDGSNATIIARQADGTDSKTGETKWAPDFIADRNNIVRTWMDHGVWPFLTTKLYLDQSGDFDFLGEKQPYFRDGHLKRGRAMDPTWMSARCHAGGQAPEPKLKTTGGELYEGTVLEHILVQTLVPFFNVGEHNTIRLEDADWNDGLDMAHERGESVAFTAMYAGNMEELALVLDRLSKKSEWAQVHVAEEILLLLDTVSNKVNYDAVNEKKARLEEYLESTKAGVSGKQGTVPIGLLAEDLRAKAAWTRAHLNKNEWISHKSEGWFNGYYDNAGRRVEGAQKDGSVRMTLTGQTFEIMAGIPDQKRIESVVKAVRAHLFDKKLGGYRLNTNFGEIQPDLGRAFSFAYGEKENGAVFSHMVVMYANALYKRGFAAAGHHALHSLYEMANDSGRSRIYPGLPEYFNNEGRGMYHFLTGSASWYTLTLLVDVFGVRGDGGDLVIEPKLLPEQFGRKGRASVNTRFAGASVKVTYLNPKKVPYENMKISHVKIQTAEIPVTHVSDRKVLIQREIIAQQPHWEIDVHLEPASA